MKPTDFSYYLTRFFTQYLPGEIGASKNTVLSYKDTFMLLLIFLRDHRNIPAEKVTFKIINKNTVMDFLLWIEKSRKCSISTRNVRLAALHSFFKFLQYESPENLLEWQKILLVPTKKTKKNPVNYMSLDGIKLLLKMPDQNTKTGRRDLALLSLMYDSGARVQEIISLTPSMIRFDEPCTIKLIGKGNKARIVPFMEPTVLIMKNYMEENGFFYQHANLYPLFQNKYKKILTRAGVNYILKKYLSMAKCKNKNIIPEHFSCHSLRHSKAMHMLQAGVNLVYIRDILGHSSVKTTELYAKADSQKKREALEKAYSDVTPTTLPVWQTDGDLLEWLKSFDK